MIRSYSPTRPTRWVAAILAVIGVGTAFLPPLLVIGLHIWAPIIITHETFGVHYTSHLMLRQTYYFVRNAHFFTLVYTYLPNWASYTFLPTATDLARTELYIDLVYLVHATLLAGAMAVVAWSGLAVSEKLAIGFVGFTPYFLTNKIIPGLTVNYHLLEALLFVVLAYLLGHWAYGRSSVTVGIVGGLALMAALAVGTKLTLLLLVVPYCALLAVPLYVPLGYKLLALIGFAVATAALTMLLLVVYLMGHVEWVPTFIHDMIRLNTDPSWLQQRIPWLEVQLWSRPTPNSAVFNVQVASLLWVLIVVTLGITAAIKRDLLAALFSGISLLVGVFCYYFILQRTAPNTFVEVGIFLIFCIVTSALIFAGRFGFIWLPRFITVVCACLAFMGLIYNNRPLVSLGLYQQASDQARAIQNVLDRHPDLPIIYYMETPRPSVIFPSPHLYALFSGEPEPLKNIFMPTYYPRVHFASPEDGVVQSPHLLVVPEYTGEERYEDLDLGMPIHVFDVYPAFSAVRGDPANTCETFEFRGDTDAFQEFVHGASTVTVCEVRRLPVLTTQLTPVAIFDGQTNLALHRAARQSSTSGQNGPEFAVDGDVNRGEVTTSLSHTEHEYQPWWEIDLGEAQQIDTIRIWNRPDAGAEELRALHVFVSEEPFTATNLYDLVHQPEVTDVFVGEQVGTPTTVSIGRPGRYVRVQRAGTGYLALGEVEVFAPARQLLGGQGRNLALFRDVLMSSIAPGSDPGAATDGRTTDGSLAHSQNEYEPWLTIDLGSVQEISAVAIWNRRDCCQEWLTNFRIFVSNVPFDLKVASDTADPPTVTNYYVETMAREPSLIPINRTGRYIRIQLADAGYLSLSEVEVFAPPRNHRDEQGLNVALGKPVTMSSLIPGADANAATDGLTVTGPLAHSMSELEPWLTIDLGSIQQINELAIWNRWDCCQEWLADLYIFISNTPFEFRDISRTSLQPSVTSYRVQSIAETPSIISINRAGRYVRIQLVLAGYLSLSEVEVFADAPSP